MKKLLNLLLVTFLFTCAISAQAQVKTKDLMGLGVPAQLASYLKANTLISDTGDFQASAGGSTLSLQEGTAASACMGTLTCNGASDVVTNTTCATTSSRVFLTRTSLDVDTTGDFYVKSIAGGTSFTVACEASDTATLNWIIFHESP